MSLASPSQSPALRPTSGTQPVAAGPSLSHDDGYDNDPDADLDDDEDEEGAAAGEVAMLNEHVVRAGYLYKRGEKRKNWKKRWFVLRSSKLAYYKNEKEYQLLRFIDMSEVHTVAAVEHKGKDHTFGIVTPSRTFYVNAGSKQEMQAWIDDLNAVKQHGTDAISASANASSQQQQQQQPLAALAPSTLGSLAVTQDDLAGVQPAASLPPGASAASTQAGGAACGILSSSDEGEQDDDWDEDEIADQAMPLPGPALGLGSTMAGLSSSPSAYASLSAPQQQQQQQLQQPKPGASLLSNPNKVIMQGYLMKQSKGRKHWRKRWFILSSSKLLYAKDHMNTKAHRVIPITSILDAIEYEPQEKDKDRERDNPAAFGPSSDASAVLSSSPSQTSSSLPSFGAQGGSESATARGAVAAGLTDSGSERERERDEAATIRTCRRSRSREMSDGGHSVASSAGAGRAVPTAIPGGAGAGSSLSASGAGASSSLLSSSATSSSLSYGTDNSLASHSGPGAGSNTTGAPSAPIPIGSQGSQAGGSTPGLPGSSPILASTSPRPPTAQLAATTLSPGGPADSSEAGTSAGTSVGSSVSTATATTATATSTGPATTTTLAAAAATTPPRARSKRKENCFKIITPKRVYLVCAPSEEEEIKWLSALRALLSTRR